MCVPSYVSDYLDHTAICRLCRTFLRSRSHVCCLCMGAAVELMSRSHSGSLRGRGQHASAAAGRTSTHRSSLHDHLLHIMLSACTSACHSPSSQRKSAAKPGAVASQHVHDHNCIPSTLHNAIMRQSTVSWLDAPGTCTRDLKLCTTFASPHRAVSLSRYRLM